MSSLYDEKTARVIERLFTAAEEGDPKVYARLHANSPSSSRAPSESLDFYDKALAQAYMPVSREGARLLYMLVRAQHSRSIVEFGTSFGISTIHLAAAVRDNGAGRVISTEVNAGKVQQARSNLAEAGVGQYVEILQGDAMETLRAKDLAPIDFVLLDGWKKMYLPILKLIEPRLSPNAIIVADDINLFPAETKTYLEYVRDPANGYTSVELPIEDGLELSVRTAS